MQLLPSLSAAQIVALGRPFSLEHRRPPYPLRIRPAVSRLLRLQCANAPSVWAGFYVWPDGAWGAVPQPSANVSLHQHMVDVYIIARAKLEVGALLHDNDKFHA